MDWDFQKNFQIMIDTKTTWNKVFVWVYWFLALEVKWFLAVVIAQYNIAEVRNKPIMLSAVRA